MDELARLANLNMIVDDLKSYREYAWKNYSFHNLVCKASHNPVLETHTRLILSRIQLALVDADMWSEPALVGNGHHQIVEHVARHDSIGAQAAMERQIQGTMQRLLLPPIEFGRRLEHPEYLAARQR